MHWHILRKCIVQPKEQSPALPTGSISGSFECAADVSVSIDLAGAMSYDGSVAAIGGTDLRI